METSFASRTGNGRTDPRDLATKNAKNAKGKKPRTGAADIGGMDMYALVPVRVDELAHAVIGAAIEVHRTLGRGFLESIYESAMAAELRARGIAFERQVEIPIMYRDVLVGVHRLDLLVEGELVVELKALNRHHDVHMAQVISYLKAGNFPLGLILNFETRLMKDGIRRIAPLL